MTSSHRGAASLVGLVGVVWFASLTKGAHDLWAACILFGCLTFLAIFYLGTTLKDRAPIHLPLVSNLIVMLFLFIVACKYSCDINTSHLELWIWFFSGVAFLLSVNTFQDPPFRLLFLKYGSLAVLPASVIAMSQYLGHTQIAFISTSAWRPTSTFTNSAIFAGFALSWAITGWHFRKRDHFSQWIFPVCLVALCLARSWWSLISLVAGFAYYYEDKIRQTLSERRNRAQAVGLLVLMMIVVTAYLKFGSSTASYRSLTDRWSWWMAGIRMALFHPWVGVGLGGYAAAWPFFKPSATLLNTLYAHSFLIQLIAETGIFGMSGIILFASRYVLLSSKNHSAPDSRAFQATVLSIVVFSSATIFLEYFIGKLMLLIFMGITVSSMSIKPIYLSRKSLFAAIFGLLWLVPSWYLPFKASQYLVRGDEMDLQRSLHYDPSLDASASALAQICWVRYGISHSALDLSSAWYWNAESLALKKTQRDGYETPR